MTPLPPACVAAVLDLYPFSDGEKVVRAVLDALVAGEGEGPWVTRWSGVEWSVFKKTDPAPMWNEADASAVAAVLNYLEAKGE